MNTLVAPGRVEYIDAIKGFSILWIVAFHFGTAVFPDWLEVRYPLSLFFFMSGIFFRPKPFRTFLSQRINALLVPFLIWFLIGWLYVVFKYEVLGRVLAVQFEGGDRTWSALSDLLKLFLTTDYETIELVALNGALWFLIGLFNVQMVFYALRRVWSRNGYLLTACGLVSLGALGWCLYTGVIGPFWFPLSMQFLLYYALGSVVGPRLIEKLEYSGTRTQIGAFVVLLAAVVAVGVVDQSTWPEWTQSLATVVGALCFIPLAFVVFRHIYSWRLLRPLLFFGRNTIVLLCTHLLIFAVTETCAIKVFGRFGSLEQLHQSVGYHVVLFFVVLGVNYFVIKFCNRYAPWLIGKKEWVRW